MSDKKAPAPSFDFELVVIHQFGFNERGKRIADPQEIASVIGTENERFCHKVAKEDPQ
ncbi:hypothetical protein [Burkholderia sp. BCC0322]|uniref:hypothetical protein n=1 Tax=unclassified Burkholderia TaxID=2613784 RepID=UPI00158DCC86|nr:hypothetical protein [Burkholderia sp. BCC0322]